MHRLTAKKHQKLGNIQILRALAAAGVILFHIVGNAKLHGIHVSIFSLFGTFGNMGVDVFFVISGFVMAESRNRAPLSATSFLARRLLRIVPLYWALTLFYYALGSFVPELFTNLNLDPNWLFASLFFLSGGLGFGSPILGQGWTLEFEMLFYLIFSMTLSLNRKLYRYSIIFFVTIILVSTVGVSSIIIEFSLGIIANMTFTLLRKRPNIGIGFVLFSPIILFIIHNYIPGSPNRVIEYGIPSYFLVCGLAMMKQSDNRLMLRLGSASYSAYLFQFFAIPFMFKLSDLAILKGINGDMVVILIASIAICSGQIIYRILEEPSSKLAMKLLSSK
jgi:exopolysaccharide production protein ExoZ